MKHLPNILTICNLLCGCIAIKLSFSGDLSGVIYASYFIFLAAIFDFLDGFAARALKAYSEIGKQLDSLADMVTFGVAPSFITYQLLNHSIASIGNSQYTLIANLAFLTAVFSSLRLAKFNVDDSQTTHFIGVPTPINAMMLAAIPSIYISNLITNNGGTIYVLILLIIFSSLMLVAPIKMIALKFKDYSFSNNKIRYSFVITSILFLVIFKVTGLFFIYLAYISFSVLNNQFEKK
jgi:CDP-diacylglycerol--serine O-phosphatidyltransferase